MDGGVVPGLTFWAEYDTPEPVLQRIIGFPVTSEFHGMRGRIAGLAIGRINCYLSPADKYWTLDRRNLPDYLKEDYYGMA